MQSVSKQKRKGLNKDALVLVSAILLFIAAAIGLYLAWDSLSNPGEVVVI